MILLPSSVRVYVATAAANLRKSFEGLSNEVRCVLGDDPLSGHVFLFLNRRGCQVKMLVWTRGGFTIVHKRLERGRFTFPERVRADAVRVEIDAHELAMLLEGLDLSSSPSARRWAPAAQGFRRSRPDALEKGDENIARGLDEITRDELGVRRDGAPKKTMRGRPGDVARELLDGGHHAEVLALVEKLAAKNEELERIIASARPESLGGRPSEQLALILEELRTTVVGANEAESEQS
ncbi:MAG: IS66 family insertion sequence element accessory protein TnpB, partial [Polyangiaceae bacterium]|nr:IS66 family insertion sequence element accessory protein TnpB [Polyangiaceae bacterium]